MGQSSRPQEENVHLSVKSYSEIWKPVPAMCLQNTSLSDISIMWCNVVGATSSEVFSFFLSIVKSEVQAHGRHATFIVLRPREFKLR